MRILTVSLILGIVAGATWLYVVPAMTWIPVVVTIAIGAIWTERSWLSWLLLCFAVAFIGATRVTQEMGKLEENLSDDTYVWYNETMLSNMKSCLMQQLSGAGINDETYAITAAMTLGDKSNISSELRQTYSDAGASHTLALSGMHLAIIYAILMGIAMALPKYILALPYAYPSYRIERTISLKGERIIIPLSHRLLNVFRLFPDINSARKIMMTMVVVILWGYVAIVGMMPSVVRAAEMLTFATICRIFFRNVKLTDTLVLAAFITLLISPLQLFNIGFQLSYAAVLGIAICFRPLNGLLLVLFPTFNLSRYSPKRKKNKELMNTWWFPSLRRICIWLWSMVCITISAQIFVTPLVAYYFHSIPCYGLFTSIIVSIGALLIVFSGAMLIVVTTPALHLAWLTRPVAKTLETIVNAQNCFLEWGSSLPYSTISEIHISKAQLTLIYIIIVSSLALIKRRKNIIQIFR